MLPTTRALRLVAFRGRSRNTSGFEPFETFELPQKELLTSATTTEVGESSPGTDQSLYFHPTSGSDVFQWVESPLGDAELAAAASRCAVGFVFMMFSLFHVMLVVVVPLYYCTTVCNGRIRNRRALRFELFYADSKARIFYEQFQFRIQYHEVSTGVQLLLLPALC